MSLKAPTAARSRGGNSATGSQLPPRLEGGGGGGGGGGAARGRGGLVTAAAELCATIRDDALVHACVVMLCMRVL
jgi:hypothetical protein